MIIPLYNKTCYSLLESCIAPKSLVEFAIQNQYKSIGIADLGNIHSIVDMHLECKKHDIKLIVGAELQIDTDISCLAYALNDNGYINLSKILTKMRLSDNHCISMQEISCTADDIAFIFMPSIHCISKKMIIETIGNDLNAHHLQWYIGCDPRYNRDTAAYMSHIFQKPVLALTKACFLYADDQIAHDVLLCIKHKEYLSEINRPKSLSTMKALTPDEYNELYKDIPFCLQNTQLFADLATFKLQLNKPILPPYGESEIEYVRNTTYSNLEQKIKSGIIDATKEDIYKERLEYELKTINDMQFISYFMIVSDFIKFAKKNDVPVGPGRGSGAGSLVAWCLDITDIDPIKFELVFERFLNPGRISMPDFDIDFGPSGRTKVIQYVQDKYGKDCVSGILTFGTLSSRAVLKDVGRVMQVPYSKTDFLSKRVKVVFGKPDSLQETYDNDSIFAESVDNDDNLSKAFHIAKKLEGLPRHPSAHAAGIIIHHKPIVDIIPLMKDINSEIPLVQVTMQHAESLGLIKYDFLGLSALDIAHQCIKSVTTTMHDNHTKVSQHKLISETLSTLPENDPKVFEMLNNGYTAGIFQFEGHGMTKLIHDVHVTNIEDLIAIVSLYRPGPMDNIPLFLQSKRHPQSIKYTYPALEQILQNTYGVIIYQEQIIKIAQEIAGFSLAEADLVRRNMGKKKVEEMDSMAQDFVQRIYEKQGGSLDTARDFFHKQVYPFANYGFNKAHAAAYAIIGYAMAYLKAYYTAEFLSISMTYEQNNTDKLKKLIYEAKKMNLKILPPDINTSLDAFSIRNGDIVCSLTAIKNVGAHNVSQILKSRVDSPFTSVQDFEDRIQPNKRELESLLNVGALDNLESIKSQNNDDEALFLFDTISNDTSNNVDYDCLYLQDIEKINMQKSLLGFYTDKTPIDIFPISNLKLTTISQMNQKNKGKIVFMIEDCKILYRYNKKYAICVISDKNHECNLILKTENDIDKANQGLNMPYCCNIECDQYSNRLIGRDIELLEDYITRLHTVNILIQEKSDIYKIQDLMKTCKNGNAMIRIYVNNQYLEIGKISCSNNFILGLQGMKWVANAI